MLQIGSSNFMIVSINGLKFEGSLFYIKMGTSMFLYLIHMMVSSYRKCYQPHLYNENVSRINTFRESPIYRSCFYPVFVHCRIFFS